MAAAAEPKRVCPMGYTKERGGSLNDEPEDTPDRPLRGFGAGAGHMAKARAAAAARGADGADAARRWCSRRGRRPRLWARWCPSVRARAAAAPCAHLTLRWVAAGEIPATGRGNSEHGDKWLNPSPCALSPPPRPPRVRRAPRYQLHRALQRKGCSNAHCASDGEVLNGGRRQAD